MAYKDWRPKNWDEIKDKILHEAEIMGSRIADKLMEEAASEILEAYYDSGQSREDAWTICLEEGWQPPR